MSLPNEVRAVRSMLAKARALGAAKFEVWTDDEGPDYVGGEDETIVEHAFSADITAVVCVDADGSRWGHVSLTPNNDGLVADWIISEDGRADKVAEHCISVAED